MNITVITYLKRKNLGNYEHEEIKVDAALAEGEDAAAAMIQLKEFVHAALNNDVVTVGKAVETPAAATTPAPAEKKQRVRASAAKETKTEAPKVETNEQGQEIPPVIPTQEEVKGASQVVGSVDTKNVTTVESKESVAGPSVAGKGLVAYDSTVKEHRSRFATYLGNNYPKWTPDAKFGKETQSAEKTKYAADVQVFSKGLHGKPFEDAKGNMLDSFKAELESFFKDAK